MPSALTVIRVAVPRPLHSLYDYHVPEGQTLPLVGARVRVPFGNSRVVGICGGEGLDVWKRHLVQGIALLSWSGSRNRQHS